jgi:hypothetical protein
VARRPPTCRYAADCLHSMDREKGKKYNKMQLLPEALEAIGQSVVVPATQLPCIF